MKKVFLLIALLLLGSVTCIEPERDGPYDPNNPSKPSLYGYTRTHDWSPLPGASVELRQGGDVKYSTESDNEAWFEFEDINPGIYQLYAQAEYYAPEVETLYLCAGCKDTIDVHFDELYFDFDSETPGTQEPFGFIRVTGSWQITEDNTGGDAHSLPNVYNAVHTGSTDPCALSLFQDTLRGFWLSVNVKVLTSAIDWYAGLVLRYQDESNYYLVQFNPNGMSLMKMRGGVLSQLASTTSQTFASNVWYHFSTYLEDDKIKVYVDYDEIFEIYDTSSPIHVGLAGLWLYWDEITGSASAHFDDLHVWP